MSRIPKGYEIEIPGCFIAGGAVLSAVTKTEINDFDLYPKTNQAMIEAFYQLIDDNCFLVNISDRAVTFKSNNITDKKGERAIIQIMTYDTFETAEKIFNNFDFTVCMGAYDCDTKTHIFHEDFYPDIASKTLRFNPGTKYPLNSILRVNKYLNKGFFISKPEHIRMILSAIQQGMPTSWKELESQIGGTYGREISLRCEDKPFTFETALNVLSNIDSFTQYEEAKEMENASNAEYLEDLFSDEVKHLVKNKYGDLFMLDKDTLVPIRKLEYDFKPKNYIILNENNSSFRMKGYKVLKRNENGTFKPGIYNSYNIQYSLGDETTELKSPYLFVYSSIEKSKSMFYTGKTLVEVSFAGDDLMDINKANEIQVQRLRIEKIIEE